MTKAIKKPTKKTAAAKKPADVKRSAKPAKKVEPVAAAKPAAKPSKPAKSAPAPEAAKKPAPKPTAKSDAAPAAKKPGRKAAPAPDVKPQRHPDVPKVIEGKPVSNYRQVRLAIIAGGADAGLAHGLALGLPLSQVRAYVKELLVMIPKQAEKKALGPILKVTKPAEPYKPHFRYATRIAAERAAIHQARRLGMAETVFHVLEEKGMFAMAPLHYQTPGNVSVPQFQKGDAVMDTVLPDSRGTIVEAGPEQCLVQYHDEVRGKLPPSVIPNVFLYKLSDLDAKKPAKVPAALTPSGKKKAGS